MSVRIQRFTNGRIIIKPSTTDENYEADLFYREHARRTSQVISEKVSSDIQHHFDKYGAQRLDDGNWLKVIVEEEGEAVAEINKQNWPDAKKEIMQVIACWMRLYMEVERMESGHNEVEASRYTRAS